MIKKFQVQDFRCFEDFTIDNLGRVNLFVGKNNVGKTTLLEALWIHFGYYNPVLPLSIDIFRGLDKFKATEFAWDLFNGFDPTKMVKLIGTEAGGRKRTVTISVKEIIEQSEKIEALKSKRQATAAEDTKSSQHRMGNSEIILSFVDSFGPKASSRAYIEDERVKYEQAKGVNRLETIFLPANRKETNEERAERFSMLARSKSTGKVIETLRILENRLEDLSILYVAGEPIIHASLTGENNLIPIPLMGDGIRRLLEVALSISYSRGGTVFIDEIENGLHYSVMPRIGQAIAELADYFDVQIFATSHSDECIFALRNGIVSASNPKTTGKLFRLERKNNKIIAVAYTLDELEIAARQGIEVR